MTDRELLKEARDLIVMCSLLDKSGQCEDMADKIDKQLSIANVSQQRKLLIATIEKVRYNLDGYGALTSSEIAERLEKAINCG